MEWLRCLPSTHSPDDLKSMYNGCMCMLHIFHTESILSRDSPKYIQRVNRGEKSGSYDGSDMMRIGTSVMPKPIYTHNPIVENM